MRTLIRLRKIEVKKYIKFLQVDLKKFQYHLNFFKRLYKRRIRVLNELIPLYHGGVQFIYLKLKQFFIDFHSTFRFFFREFRINYKSFSSYFRYFIKCGRYFMKHFIKSYNTKPQRERLNVYFKGLPLKSFIVIYNYYFNFAKNFVKYKRCYLRSRNVKRK